MPIFFCPTFEQLHFFAFGFYLFSDRRLDFSEKENVILFALLPLSLSLSILCMVEINPSQAIVNWEKIGVCSRCIKLKMGFFWAGNSKSNKRGSHQNLGPVYTTYVVQQ